MLLNANENQRSMNAYATQIGIVTFLVLDSIKESFKPSFTHNYPLSQLSSQNPE